MNMKHRALLAVMLLVSMPALAQSWEPLAKEWESFTVVGEQRVRFGVDTRWIERSAVNSGQCTKDFFGSDPAEMVVKACQVWVPATTIPRLPGTATLAWGASVSIPPQNETITYTIYQGQQGQAKTAVPGGTTGALSFVVNGDFAANETVCWHVTGRIGANESAPSNEACKKFPPPFPALAAPQGLSVN